MLNLMDQTMWRYVAEDIMAEMKYAKYAILLGSLVYLIIRCVLSSKNKGGHHFIKLLLFIYLTALVYITLMEREPGTRTGVSLTLFQTIGDSRSNAYVMENILLFIPFGFLAALLIRPMSNIFVSLLAGSLFSLAIETVQLITQRGHFQVDDIWTNSIGMVIGCICFWLCRIVCDMIGYNHKSG